jgi:hypothetical protein
MSAVALTVQVANTDYGVGHAGAAGLWLLLGCLLLWLVYRRRSRAARGFVIVTSLAGTVVYSIIALTDASSGVLAVLFLSQALPLLSRQVRRHVQSAP